MLHNKEVKQLIFVEILIFLLCLGVGYVAYQVIEERYEQEIIEKNAYLVSSLVSKHPEWEEDIIDALTTYSGSYENGLTILEKYGLDDMEGIGYLNDIESRRREYQTIHFFVTTVIFLALSISYILFVKKQYQKIHEINHYMNCVLNGKELFDIRDYEEGDISSLKNDVYKITTVLKEQKELANQDKLYLESTLSDISHQLRTPLTSMYVINDLLLDSKLTKEKRKEMLGKNRAQLERIEWLVTSLLKMSRLDSGVVELKKEKVDASLFLNQVVEPIRIPIELKLQTLILDIPEHVVLEIDPNWTLEALLNIVKKAHEHTPEGGTIHIEVIDNPLYVGIEIKDDGSGIKKEDLPHIFERFYKGKSDNKDSIGIGLNMAYKIIDKQNGEIRVKSKEGEGTIFSIRFYKNRI